MHAIIRTTTMAAVLTASASVSRAAWIDLPVFVDGAATATTYTIGLDAPLALTSQTTLSDGSILNTFQVPLDPESFNFATFYSKLFLDGSSSVSYYFGYDIPCHGGCGNWARTNLEFHSADNSLFVSTFDLGVLDNYQGGSGHSEQVDYDFVTYEGIYVEHDYVFPAHASPTPEPEACLAVLAGLAVVGALGKMRHPKARGLCAQSS